MSGLRTVDEPWTQGPGLLASVWEQRRIVAALTILGLVLGYALSTRQEPSYEAVARLFLSDPRSATVVGSTGRPAINPEQYVPQQTERVTSRPILERAVEELESVGSPEDLRDAVTVVGEVELGVISVVARAGNPEDAAERANALAAAYQAVTAERTLEDAQAAVAELEEARVSLRQTIEALERQLQAQPDDIVVASQLEAFNQQLLQLEIRGQEVLVEAAVRGSGVDLLERAEVPDAPSGPGAVPYIVLLGMLGGAVGAVIAYWRSGRGGAADNHQEPAHIIGAPLLGEIPAYKPVKKGSVAQQLVVPPAVTEAFQLVLASLELALHEIDGRVVLVTSALPGDGKTTAAIQLAVVATRDERPALLVDADVRATGVTQELGASDRRGLVQLSEEGGPLRDAVHPVILEDGAKLLSIPAGGSDISGAALFRSEGFGRSLAACREAVDLVLIDSPPVLAVADTLLIASRVDAIVVVVNRGTPLEDLERLRDRLAFVPTPVIGYVYNRSSPSGKGLGYGYAEQPQRKQRRQRRRHSANGRSWNAPTGVPAESQGIGRRR